MAMEFGIVLVKQGLAEKSYLTSDRVIIVNVSAPSSIGYPLYKDSIIQIAEQWYKSQ